MKTMKLFAGIALVAFAACTNEDKSPAFDLDTPIALDFGVSLSTRAAITADQFEVGDAVGVYMGALTDTEASAGELGLGKFNNVEYTLSAASSWSGEALYWQNTTQYHTLYAYAPYTADASAENTGISISLPEDQSAEGGKSYKAADYLWGQLQPMLATTAPQTFELAHKMSQIVITIQAGAGMEADELTSMSLALQGTFPSVGTFNLKTGTCTATGDGSTLASITPYRHENTFYAIVLPGTGLKDAKVVLTATASGQPTTYSYKIEEDITTAGSKKYEFSLSVNKGELQLVGNGFTISPWSKVVGDDDGSADMEVTVP